MRREGGSEEGRKRERKQDLWRSRQRARLQPGLTAAPASPALPALPPSGAPGRPVRVREAAGVGGRRAGSFAPEGRRHSPRRRLPRLRLRLASPEVGAACPEEQGWPAAGLRGDPFCWEHPRGRGLRPAGQKDRHLDPARCSGSQSGVPHQPHQHRTAQEAAPDLPRAQQPIRSAVPLFWGILTRLPSANHWSSSPVRRPDQSQASGPLPADFLSPFRWPLGSARGHRRLPPARGPAWPSEKCYTEPSSGSQLPPQGTHRVFRFPPGIHGATFNEKPDSQPSPRVWWGEAPPLRRIPGSQRVKGPQAIPLLVPQAELLYLSTRLG